MQTLRIAQFALTVVLSALVMGVITGSTPTASVEASTGKREFGQAKSGPLLRFRDVRRPDGDGQNAPNVQGPIGSTFPIVDETVDAVVPSVAYNSHDQEYLVVWSRDLTSYADIYGQRVSKTGKLVGPAFAISSGTGARRLLPKIAYNTASNEYLIVWMDWTTLAHTISGRRISATGTPLDTEISFNTIIFPNTYYEYPSVAYASTSDLYLVVWQERNLTTFNVVGRTLSGAGVLDIGKLIVYLDTPATGPGIAPRLAYNRERNEFLVACRQGLAALAIYGQRVKLTGGTDLAGLPLELIPSVTTSYGFAVAALPSPAGDGQYLVIGEQQASSTEWWLAMRQVPGIGIVLGSPSIVAVLPNPGSNPEVVGSEAGQEYLLTWTHETSSYSLIRSRAISSEGIAQPDNPDGLGAWAAGSSVAAGPSGDFLVVFQEDHSPLEPGPEPYDILGALFGNRLYLPLLVR